LKLQQEEREPTGSGATAPNITMAMPIVVTKLNQNLSMRAHSSPRPFSAALALLIFALVPGPALSQSSDPSGQPPICAVPQELTRLDYRLARTARRLETGGPLTIVAIGSSSTGGAGASSSAASYPSRLAVELKERFPARTIRVVNRGANGEDVSEMLARMQESVIAEDPDLVLWQVGTNSLLLDRPLTPAGALIRKGLRTLKAAGGIDVVLIDPQFAPKVLAKADIGTLMSLYDTVTKQETVGVFHRFAVMRYWHEVAGIPFETFLSPDQLHMNDWSYACVAKLLATAIAEAASRSTVTAKGPRP
jgi:acyl-CoA thioesterase-1